MTGQLTLSMRTRGPRPAALPPCGTHNPFDLSCAVPLWQHNGRVQFWTISSSEMEGIQYLTTDTTGETATSMVLLFSDNDPVIATQHGMRTAKYEGPGIWGDRTRSVQNWGLSDVLKPYSLWLRPDDGVTMLIQGNDFSPAFANLAQRTLDSPYAIFPTPAEDADEDATGTYGTITSIEMAPDGLKEWICSFNISPFIYEWDFGTAWDITTRGGTPVSTYQYDTFPSCSGKTAVQLRFSPDGMMAFFLESNRLDLVTFTLAAARDLSSPSFVRRTDMSGLDSEPFGGFDFSLNGRLLFFNSRISRLIVPAFTWSQDLYETAMTTPWDTSTHSWTEWVGEFYDYSGQETDARGFVYAPSDALRGYIVGFTGDDVNQYDMSAAGDMSTATFDTSFSLSARGSDPVDIALNLDEDSFWTIYANGDVWHWDITGGDMGTAFDNPTTTSEEIATWEAAPTGFCFGDEGRYIYVVGGNDNIYRFDGGANKYSFGNATNDQDDTHDVSAFATGLSGVAVSIDGTKIYISTDGPFGQQIWELTLATPWLPSSESSRQVYRVRDATARVRGFDLTFDGFRMTFIGGDENQVYGNSMIQDYDA